MTGTGKHRTEMGRYGLLLALVAGAGCSHVGQDEFQTEMDALRYEMQRADAGVEQRVDGVEDRLGSRIEDLDARLSRLDAELRLALGDLEARIDRLDESLRVYAPVHFGFDDARLEDAQLPVLDRLSSVLIQYYPGALITVEGFTDPAGSAEYNMRLGMARAESVVEYLTNAGLDSRQMRAVSYGEDTSRLVRPGERGPGVTGRENRRVVVVIDHPGTWTAVADDST